MNDRVYRGQVYRFAGTTPYTRRDGSETTLAHWFTECADCGRPFLVSTPSASKKFVPSRRCAAHKRPGARVKAVQP